MTNQEFIQQLIEDINQIIRKVETTYYTLEHDKLNWRETSEKWSILECFEHLNRYHRYYNPAIELAVKKAKSDSSNLLYKSRWMGRIFINMMDPKNTKKQKTLKHLNPSGSNLGEEVVEEFINHQHQVVQLLEKATQVDLNLRAVPVEFMRILKLSIGDALKFVVTHEKRHVLQAENTLQKQNFQRVDLIV